MIIAHALSDQKIHEVIDGASALSMPKARSGRRRSQRASAFREVAGRALIAVGIWVRGASPDLIQSRAATAYHH